jgi:hypothetical protein
MGIAVKASLARLPTSHGFQAKAIPPWFLPSRRLYFIGQGPMLVLKCLTGCFQRRLLLKVRRTPWIPREDHPCCLINQLRVRLLISGLESQCGLHQHFKLRIHISTWWLCQPHAEKLLPDISQRMQASKCVRKNRLTLFFSLKSNLSLLSLLSL